MYGVVNGSNFGKTVQKYSFVNKTWEKVADMYDIIDGFCACSFMDCVYFIGPINNSCIEFNTTTGEWRQVAGTKQWRRNASCTAFEGRIVVSGTMNFLGHNNTVEAYDHVANTWYDLPNMVEGRSGHKSVAITNKLFVIGGSKSTGEVFDSGCNKFVLLKLPTASVGEYLWLTSAVVTLGYKLVIFNNRENRILFYDIENDEFSEEECEVAKV